MKDRLATFLKNEGLSPSRFAEMMGVPPSNVSHLLAGRNKPGFEFISKMILRFPKVSPDWLLTGSGPMYRSDGDLVSHPEGGTDKPEAPELFPTDIAPAKPKIKKETAQSEPSDPETLREAAIRPALKLPGGDRPDSMKEIERIIILFDDHTFSSFNPSSGT